MTIEPFKTHDLGDATDTQPIHSELGDGVHDLPETIPVDDDTLPVDDNLPLGYEFETQRIDFEDQIHQGLDLCAETQQMDECNPEVPVNGECEGSDETEILSDTQVLSDEDSVRSGGSCLVDHGITHDPGLKEQSDSETKIKSDVMCRGDQHSGCMLGGFTSIRAASIKASGLAARNMALERMKSHSCSTRCDNFQQVQNSEKDGVSVNKGSLKLDYESDLKNTHEDYDKQAKECSYENAAKVSSSAVRKLFADDMVFDGGKADGGVNNRGRDGLLNSFAFENVLGGLSYIISEEPGELSQANALGVVDKFLERNIIEGVEDVALKELTGGKSEVASRARGAQSLAKEATTRNTEARHGAFKWDDSFEDEGGGGFLKNKKGLFFGKGSQKRKTSRNLNSKSSTAAEKVRNKKKPDSKQKVKASVLSDSKPLSENHGRNSKSSNLMKASLMKNLIEDLNEEIGNISRDGLVGNGPDNTLPDMLDVGFDTQLAADAMEDLRFGVGLSCNDGINVNEGPGQKSLEKCAMQEQPDSSLPTAHHSRGFSQMSRVKCGKDLNCSKESAAVSRKKERLDSVTSALGDASKLCESVSDKDYKPWKASSRELNQWNPRIFDYPRKRRTRSQVPWTGQDASTGYNTRSKRSKLDSTSISKVNESSKQRLSASGTKRKSPADGESSYGSRKNASHVKIGRYSNVNTNGEVNANQDASPEDRCKPSISASKTPVSCATPINAASPICKGDEYHRQSCWKNLRSSLMKEISSLAASGTEITSPVKDSRRRKDMANVRVLFSHHLDADIVKQQKKILTRLGASDASSMSVASHFVTDKFVRTKNMLEAIAFGKPVVTHLWLECCGQASCFIDERNYILRDTRKEKEFCFTMPVSLARAGQQPLLQGRKVLITPNTKPGKDILKSLVKAVHGLAMERLGRSLLKDKLPDDLLVLSCEEDYDICLPFLEKGAAVYSSELLLNGIVTQRLEYERHRLFTDNVKKTRSAVWLKRDNEHLPVNKGI